MATTSRSSSRRRLLSGISSRIAAISPSTTYEREALLIFILGLTAFYGTALFSFSPLDASLVAGGYPPSTPTNLAGAMGANLAGAAVFVFGITAWLLPLPFVTSAIMMVRNQPTPWSRSRYLGWLTGIAALSCLAAVELPAFQVKGFELPTGGVIGEVVAHHLMIWLGEVGRYIAIATATVCSFMLIFRTALITPTLTNVRKACSQFPRWEGGNWARLLRTAPNDHDIPRLSDSPDLHDQNAEPTPVVNDEEGPALGLIEPAALFNLGEQAAPARPRPPRPDYAPPPISVFDRSGGLNKKVNQKELEDTAALLIRTFEDFGIQGKVVGYQPGPVVTVFEYQPQAGIKQSKVMSLIDDLALALKVDSIFINPVRGKRALGIQVPNRIREVVCLGDVVATQDFEDSPSPLTFGMGRTLSGQAMCSDLATMPHLLAAGATGSGKSVAINAMLCSIIMKASPEDVRMILVDPKMLELSVYEGIPHLLMPVITEPARASLALKWAAKEMERRYRLMQIAQVRNITGFNNFWAKANQSEHQRIRDAMKDDSIDKMPYILLVIDELADLMLTAPKDVESSIQRLAQKARASGIHMVLATQRPSVDVITGVIKANLPCRIAFQVVSKHDSRTILDVNGAEKLLGKGDMLLQRPGVGRLERIQGALISDEEVLNLVAAAKVAGNADYDDSIMDWIETELSRDDDSSDATVSMDDDPKWDEAISVAQKFGVVSASFLQRHLKIGYNRAARIVEAMEAQQLVGRADGSKPRKWLGPDGSGSAESA